MRVDKRDRELLIVCLARGLRTFGFGSVSVILALYLANHHFSSFQVGSILSATLIEDAIFTTLVSLFALKLGMKRVLLGSTALMILSGIALGYSNDPLIIALAAVCGIFSPAGFEGGPFTAVEQAIIARDIASEKLTGAFSFYNLIGFAGAAVGSLTAGLCVAHYPQVAQDMAYRLVFLSFICSSIIMALLYAALPKHLLVKPLSPPAVRASLGTTTRALLQKKKAGALVLLQGLDSFGGGFVVQSLIAYWFYTRYHAGADFTGGVFCLANIFAAVSFLAAPYLAGKIGLLRTMVFTHLPCSIALGFIPFMPTAQLAAALLLGRSFFSSMDIPARQAYTMLLVHPDDRTAVAGLTTASRAIAQAVSPVISGLLSASVPAGSQFVIASVCKTVYDVCLYGTFKKIPLASDESSAFVAVDTSLNPKASMAVKS